MTEVTCGIFLVDPYDQLLIVHSTNARWNTWGIPKGIPEECESYKEAAIRELYEETYLDIESVQINYLGSSKYLKCNKILEAFWILLDKPIIMEDLKCLSMVEKDGKEPFPELDKYMTVSLDDAHKWLHQTQIDLLPLLKEKIMQEKGCKTVSIKPKKIVIKKT